MALNKIARFVEACSDDELDGAVYWHDCFKVCTLGCFDKGGWTHNRHLPNSILLQSALSVCGGSGGQRSAAQLWPLRVHFSDRHLSLCGGLCAVIDYWPPQQSHHSTQLRSPQYSHLYRCVDGRRKEAESNSTRNTCYDEWKADTLNWSVCVLLYACELVSFVFRNQSTLTSKSHHIEKN